MIEILGPSASLFQIDSLSTATAFGVAIGEDFRAGQLQQRTQLP